MNSMKHRSKGRGGSRGQRNFRTENSPPLQRVNAFSNIEDGNSFNIYENKYFVYYITSNLGETARIVIRNGDIYEGILRAVSPKFDCTLNEAHLVYQRQANGHIEDEFSVPCKDDLISQLVIALKDMVSVNITKIHDPELRTAVDNFTDEAISGSHRETNGQQNERPLQKWIPQEGDLAFHGGLEEDMKMNGWDATDMFKTNAEKFGVTSTYNDNLLQYTTPLPKDSTREMELRAEQTAREIEESRGYSLHEEVERGKSEEESFASVLRPQPSTTVPSKPAQQLIENSVSSPKPHRAAQAKPATGSLPAERSSATVNADLPATCVVTSVSSSTVVVSSPVTTVTAVSSVAKTTVSVADVVATVSKPDSTEPTKTTSSTTSQSSEIVKGLKDFYDNFQLAEKPSHKTKEQDKESEKTAASGVTTAPPEKTPTEELPPSETAADDTKGDSKKTNTSSSDSSILATSKLNPLAKEFKCSPKPQKTTPPPQPQPYVPLVAAGPPYSPTSVRPGHPSGAFPQPVVMVQPQPMNVYRPGKQPPFNKPRGHSYGGREQGEPFITAAAATGSPIFTPGGTFPQSVYHMPPPPQPLYVQPAHGMVTQQISAGQFVIPHPRFITPVNSPAGGPPVSQAYPDTAPMPIYVAGNMGTVQGNPAPQSQPPPQPSPSQPGQFIFTVPQMAGPPQSSGPPQGPGPAHYGQSQMIYIAQPPPQVGPPASSVPVSASTAPVPYMAGSYHGERLQ